MYNQIDDWALQLTSFSAKPAAVARSSSSSSSASNSMREPQPYIMTYNSRWDWAYAWRSRQWHSFASASDCDEYNCKITLPWTITDGINTGQILNGVTLAHINNIIIGLPNWNTINLTVHIGTYSVQAVNCQGTSNWVNYLFQREADWWCDCVWY